MNFWWGTQVGVCDSQRTSMCVSQNTVMSCSSTFPAWSVGDKPVQALGCVWFEARKLQWRCISLLACPNEIPTIHWVGILLNNRNLLPTVLEASGSRATCRQVWFLLTPLPLACRWMSSASVLLTWSSLWVCTPLVSLVCPHFSSHKDARHISSSYKDKGHTPMALF